MNEEIWKFLEGECKIYTESKELYKQLVSSKKVAAHLSATYMNKGKSIGWDFIFPEKQITEIRKLIKEINAAEKRHQKDLDKAKSKVKKN